MVTKRVVLGEVCSGRSPRDPQFAPQFCTKYIRHRFLVDSAVCPEKRYKIRKLQNCAAVSSMTPANPTISLPGTSGIARRRWSRHICGAAPEERAVSARRTLGVLPGEGVGPEL